MTPTQNNLSQEEIATMNGEHLLEVLHWRYATKCMNGKKVPEETMERILEAIRLAPSSFGIQPYTIILIENKELLEKVKSAANEQPVVVEASHILVFAVWENVIQKKIDDLIYQTATERGISQESLHEERSRMESQLAFPPATNQEWSARQAYIALSHGLIAAALEQVDATPMEGFNPSAMDAILGLREKGLKSVVLMALGYRDTERDPLANAKKIRRNKEALFIKM
jgi:nitroreductase/dihydropteridine reductase